MGERTVWREAYQSSPAAAILRSDADFRAFAQSMQLPADYAETLRTRPVSGTLRLRLRIPGLRSPICIRVSNEEGVAPLLIARATIGVGNAPSTMTSVTFGGEQGLIIPVGAPAISDPIALPDHADGDVVLSFHLPEQVALGGLGQCHAEVAPGDQTLAQDLDAAVPLVVRPFVTAIMQAVEGASGGVIAVLGDSLSDAHCSMSPVWPELLQRRLTLQQTPGPLFVSNAAIGGNRLLSPGLYPEMGLSGLARLDRDILRIEGLAHVIVLLGTNDIGLSGGSYPGGGRPIGASDLVAGYRQVIARTRMRGAQAILGTLLPFAGSSHHTGENEATRQAVNHWIRTSGEPDAMIDFEAAVRDPQRPTALRGDYDLGDHLHLTGSGAQALADAIDLSLFKSP